MTFPLRFAKLFIGLVLRNFSKAKTEKFEDDILGHQPAS